jgi:peptide/nickel transport system substrate-binding protein
MYFERIKKNQRLRIFEYPVLAYTFLGLNLKKPLFSDLGVRQALAYAINRVELVNSILLGHGLPCYAPTVPVSWAYTDEILKFEYQPEKAAEILKNLGWQKGSDGILIKNGEKFEFTVFTNQGNAEREKAAVIIQQQLKKIGVKMNIQVMEWGALIKRINGPEPKDFEAVFMGWSLGIDPDDYTIWHSSQYPNGFNFIGYSNQQVDRLLEAGRRTLNQTQRKVIYRRLYQIISEEQPYIFLWTARALEAVNKKIKNLAPPGPAGLFINMEQIDLEE